MINMEPQKQEQQTQRPLNAMEAFPVVVSDNVTELFTAMSKAQAEIKSAIKDSKNPYYNSKYADLSAVLEVIRPVAAANGLAYMQLPSVDGGKVQLCTIVSHTSGQHISSVLTLTPDKNATDPQSVGKCITYARRYALASIFAVTQEDDDGNSSSGVPVNSALQAKQTPKQQSKQQPEANATQSTSTALDTQDMKKKIVSKFGLENFHKFISKYFGVENLADLPREKDKYTSLYKWMLDMELSQGDDIDAAVKACKEAIRP